MANTILGAGSAIPMQPEIGAIYDRLGSLSVRLNALDMGLYAMADRAMGTYPSDAKGPSAVRPVADGAASKINEELDGMSVSLDRIANSLERLARFV